MTKDSVIIELSEKYNKTPSQVTLRWIIQQNAVVIPKSAKKRRLKENIDIYDFSTGHIVGSRSIANDNSAVFQGLSIDFSFSGTRSKNEERAQDYEGINGETSWILISDHFTRHLTGDTRLSKASPIHWLRQFLDVNTPNCPGKYVYLDQGGELYHNPAVRKLFAQKGYAIRPTGADASHQNGPVERSHRTVANQIRCLLSGANLPTKFWPYAFHHSLRILNALSSCTQSKSPRELATGKRENLQNFKIIGSRV